MATFDFDIIRKLESASFPLAEIAESKDGIVPFIRDKLVSLEPKDERYRPLLGIAGLYVLDRYELQWGGTWICYDFDEARQYIDDPEELRKVQLRDESIFIKGAKIITRQNSPMLRGTIDTRQFYHTNSIHSTFLKDPERDYRLPFILALLSSASLNYYHRTLALKGRDIHPQILVTNIPKLPIRRISFTTPTGEREQIAEEAKAKAEEAISALVASGAIGSNSPLDRIVLSKAASPALEFVKERLAAKPEQSDVVHDLLAYLAEQMIAMNKEKRAAVEAFWLDLEGVAEAAAFETLRNRGKQECTLWKKAEVCRPFVREESHSTRRLDESLGWSDDAFKAFVKVLLGKVQGLSELVGVYRAHSPSYRELVGRIEATDWLIDQIVYQLYGLTEEEIAIVEGG